MAGSLLALLVVTSLQNAPAAQTAPSIQLEVRVFDGAEDVSAHARVQVYRAESRDHPIVPPSRGPRHIVRVEPGFYDAQAILEREGRVVGIRWAERLAVMAYPDEDGRHLEVVNLKAGYGALQVRARGAAAPAATLTDATAADRSHALEPAARADDWLLFVVPAGRYHLAVEGVPARGMRDLEIPADHTRLKVLP
jgi:hypothetical protein